MDKCEHCITASNENLLEHDEYRCVRCRKLTWTSSQFGPQLKLGQNLNESYFDANNGTVICTVLENQNEHLEDSPLLINLSQNDIYRESADTDFHCHDTLRASEDVTAWQKLCAAAAFCLMFMVVELIGGYLAGSLAVMTDAAHLFSDFIGFLISLLAIWVGRKPPSKNMTFGYHRAEVLGALLSVLTIWLLAAIFSTLAINRLYNDDYQIEANTMIIIASLGLFVNIVMGGILHGVCHTHSHSMAPHNHAGGNINVRAAAIHVLGDFLQSIGVLVASVIIKFYPTAKMADPVCTLAFSLLVLCTTVKVAKDSVWFLIEGSPIDTNVLKAEIKKIAGIKHVHSLQAWTLAPGKNAVAVHLAVDQYCDRDLLLKKATSVMQSQVPLVSCTIQIEAYNQELISSCKTCQSVHIRC